MNLILNYSEGRDHLELLKRIDFRALTGPLLVDIDRVPFFYPPTLAILYGAFKFHQAHYPDQERKCIPPSLKSSDTDVNRYVQRVNFFNCCPELSLLREENFKRHETSDRFVPLTEIYSMDDTDRVSEEIVQVIFSKSKALGQKEVKYVLSELIDNALQHSRSPVGCVAQVQLYRNSFVDGVILDCGMGIRKHLAENQKIAPLLTSDEIALLKAIETKVSGTHNRKINAEDRTKQYHNAGLGLSVSCELMKRSGGFLELISGDACIRVDQNGVQSIPIAGWPGTLISFRINYQNIASVADIIREFDRAGKTGENSIKPSKIEFI